MRNYQIYLFEYVKMLGKSGIVEYVWPVKLAFDFIRMHNVKTYFTTYGYISGLGGLGDNVLDSFAWGPGLDSYVRHSVWEWLFVCFFNYFSHICP